MKRALFISLSVVIALTISNSSRFSVTFPSIVYANHISGGVTFGTEGLSGGRTITPHSTNSQSTLSTGSTGRSTYHRASSFYRRDTPGQSRYRKIPPSDRNGNYPGKLTSSSGLGSAKGGLKSKTAKISGAATVKDELPILRVEVVDAEGHIFIGWDIGSGIDDLLKVKIGNKVEYIDIFSIKTMEFGDQDFNRLEVSLKLAEGKTLKGTVHAKTVFEFFSEDGVKVAYANKLSSISLKQE